MNSASDGFSPGTPYWREAGLIEITHGLLVDGIELVQSLHGFMNRCQGFTVVLLGHCPLLLPAVQVSQGFIHEVRHIGIGLIGLSSKARLMTAFLCEVWTAHLRHPNFHRVQPGPAKGIAAHLNY
jgi:hypothetical protein